MAHAPLTLSESEQTIVFDEFYNHPDDHVRRKMHVLWLTHCGTTRQQTARITQRGRATVQRYLAAYRQGGLEQLRRCDITGPVSALADHRERIRQSLTDSPVRTIAEASERIFELTGLRRGLTQTRVFLAAMGFRWQRTRAIPVPPKSR